MTNPSLIFKFGEHEHMRQFLRGLLYMNDWAHFQACENKTERDWAEGTSVWFNPHITDISLFGHPFKRETGTLSASLSYEEKNTKIFCTSGFWRLEDRAAGCIFDKKVMEHGPSMVVIHNTKIFYDRLSCALRTLVQSGVAQSAKAGRVTYFPEDDYDGEVGPFLKRDCYKHEKEWRIVINGIRGEGAYTLDIGDLSDCAEIGLTADFKNRVEARDDGSINISI